MLRLAVSNIGVCLFALGILGSQQSRGAEAGANRPLSLAGKSRMSVTWQGQELGAALDRLSSTQDLELWIDRRVDRQQTIDIALRNVSVDQALKELTASLHLGYSPLRRVVYIGPPDASQEIGGLCELAADSLKQAPSAVQRRWLQTQGVNWPRLSVPRQLLRDWLQQAGVRLEHDERIVHDLWPAGQYTSLSLMERVVLLLAGYDMTCRLSPDGRLCTVVPIERPVRFTRTYKFAPRQSEAFQRFRGLFPDALVEQKGEELVLRGDWQQHQQMAALLATVAEPRRSPQPARSRTSRRVYSLRIENQPLGGVLDQLAQQWQIAVTWAPDIQGRLSTLRGTSVSCDVHQVDEEGLLRAILEPAGLGFRRSEGRLEILPAE